MPTSKTTAATARKGTATAKRRPAAKKPDMVLKSSVGAIALNKTLNTGVLMDLSLADPDDDMAELRITISALREGCHDDASLQRIRTLPIAELKKLMGEWVAKCQVDGTSVGESSGS